MHPTIAEGRGAIYRTTIEPFEANKTEKVMGADFGGYDMIKAADKYYMLANGAVYKLNLDQNKVDKVDMSYHFDRNLAGEFSQMFDEAWAGLDENYYDGNFHGANWAKMHDDYQSLRTLFKQPCRPAPVAERYAGRTKLIAPGL
jgi:tricorn protease